jgi:hypothetical protein
MPIKPENKDRYPKEWKSISEYIRFERAKNKCEVCGLPNYAVGYRDNEGNFIPDGGNILHDLAGDGLSYPSLQRITYKDAREIADGCNIDEDDGHYIVIVLTVAHLDHNPENCDPANLKAMCQRCHNRYDRAHRSETINNYRNRLQLSLEFDRQTV